MSKPPFKKPNPPQRPPDSRTAALDILDQVLTGRRLLDDVLATEPSLARLPQRDHAFVRLLVATCLRRLGQIDAVLATCLDKPLGANAARVKNVLRLGACQLLFLETAPHAAIATSVDQVKGTRLNGFSGLVNAVLRRLDREGRALVAAQNAGRINTPDWMWESWCAAYGPETAQAIADAHLSEAAQDITAAKNPESWASRLDAELMPTGSLRRKSSGPVTGLPGFKDGAWWVQDMAAALPARLLGDVKGKDVADLCAAPGGKALQLAVRGAHVTALDKSARRLARMVENLQRMNLTARIVEADLAAWETADRFDAVLLDAPCTATGTLRRHPDGLRLKGPGDVAALADQQSALLDVAAGLLRPGGVLVYCVCSLEAEEGPFRIQDFLSRHPHFVRRPIQAAEVGGLSQIITPQGDLRTLPCHLAEQGGMDAFFAARLELQA